jgi:hypothetical protein
MYNTVACTWLLHNDQLLYVSGALAVIPTLARLLEPLRLYSAVPLHKTSIRNEQAYYSCIMQVRTVDRGAFRSVTVKAISNKIDQLML